MSEAIATDLQTPQSIPRVSQADREADELGFWSLRTLAIARAQAASGKVWTDYNLHDPGVTLLEAVCYALTELVYRADFDVADHLCGEDGAIDSDRQALFPPEEIFPCRATTAADIRRTLLDRDPKIREARLARAARVGSPHGFGLHRLRLLPTQAGEAAFKAAVSRAWDAYRQQRGLGEDLDEDVALITLRECSLVLDAEVGGARDPADVLAEILDVCADFIAPLPAVQDPRELRLAGRSLEAVFTGPPMVSGYIDEAGLSQSVGAMAASALRGRPDQISLSDLRVRLLAVEGVVDVNRLSLDFDPREDVEADDAVGVTRSGQVLTWNGALDVPVLKLPWSDTSEAAIARREVPLPGITLRRRGAPFEPDGGEVAARYADLRAGHGPRRGRAELEPAEVEPPPRGVFRPAEAYSSISQLFPPLYGLGEPTAPRATDDRAPDGAGQFRTYLALFDQMLANGASQLRHIRDLFTSRVVDGRGRRLPTQWPDLLEDGSVPGIEALYGEHSLETVKRRIFEPYDDVVERRHQVLDYLLALYGEVFAQNTLSQFLDFLDSRERSEVLVDNKAAYLRELVILSRDRAGGFDYGVPLWQDRRVTPPPTPGPQLRIALLLGFVDPHARSLTSHLARHRRRLTVAPFIPSGEPAKVAHADHRALSWPEARRPALTEAEALEALGTPHAPPAALFQYAVDRRRYRWCAEEAGGQLLLQDDAGTFWDLGHYGSERRAGQVAAWLRRHMLGLTVASEGLHLVEHILLRPRAEPKDTRDLALKVTLVAPSWTARTVRPAFRNFASETARINCPAHLAIRCLWLGLDEMAHFEEAFARWTEALRKYCVDGGDDAALDAAAEDVLRLIEPAWAD